MERKPVAATVAVGTYEGGLLVYKIDLIKGHHTPLFTAKDNISSLKALHISKSMLYTGGKDEVIRAYDLKKRSSEGGISGQTGTISKILESEKYLLCSGSDGNILIHGINDLTTYESLNCHPSEIIDFDVHKSGRIMVSLGIDKKIKLWNLMDMKEAYHKNIWKMLDFVRFAPDGNLLLGYGKEIVIFNVEDNSIGGSVEHDERITCVEVFEDFVVSGDDSGVVYIRFYENRSDMSCIRFKAYDKRVKALQILSSGDQKFLVTVSTEGYITVFGIEILLEKVPKLENKIMDFSENFEPIYHFEISSRIICLAAKLNFANVKVDLNKKKSKAKEEKASLNRKIVKRKLMNGKLKKLKKFKKALT